MMDWGRESDTLICRGDTIYIRLSPLLATPLGSSLLLLKPYVLTFFAMISFITCCTLAFACDTHSLVVAVYYFTFVDRDVTFRSFPSNFAAANALYIPTMATAMYRTDTW